jgi:hypothetical protein
MAGLAGFAGGFCAVAGVALIPWGTGMFGPALRAGGFTSISSPWRVVRSGLRLLIGETPAENVIKVGAVLLGAGLLFLLISHFRQEAEVVQRCGAQFMSASAFALVFAWLLAWPYVLPWYDGLSWALIALLPASRFVWLMLARTAGLAIGYLPARAIPLPAGLGWLETVVRTAITPIVLLAVVALAVQWLWPARHPALVTA